MKSRRYLIIGVLVFLSIVIMVFVLRVFASEDAIFVEDCTPYNVMIQKDDQENTVDISWESKKKCAGYILYGGEMKDLNMVGVDLDNEIESKYHSVIVKELISTKRYYFSIISNGISYGKDGLPIQFSISSL